MTKRASGKRWGAVQLQIQAPMDFPYEGIKATHMSRRQPPGKTRVISRPSKEWLKATKATIANRICFHINDKGSATSLSDDRQQCGFLSMFFT